MIMQFLKQNRLTNKNLNRFVENYAFDFSVSVKFFLRKTEFRNENLHLFFRISFSVDFEIRF